MINFPPRQTNTDTSPNALAQYMGALSSACERFLATTAAYRLEPDSNALQTELVASYDDLCAVLERNPLTIARRKARTH